MQKKPVEGKAREMEECRAVFLNRWPAARYNNDNNMEEYKSIT
jgi:hypothetical protein